MAISPFPAQFDLQVRNAKIDEQLHVILSTNVHGELNVAGAVHLEKAVRMDDSLSVAGAVDFGGGVTVNTLRFPFSGVGAGQWPGVRASAPEQIELQGSLRVSALLEVGGNLSVTGITKVGGDAQVAGNLQVTGILDAAALHQNGQPFVGSNWTKVAEGISYVNGNVGIGTAAPGTYKLKVEGGDTHLSGSLTVDGAVTVLSELTTGNIIWGNTLAAIHYGNRGRFGASSSFNPDNDKSGLWVEGVGDDGESGGIFMNGNTLCLWSPGDNNLLRLYDEDDFSTPKFVIDGNGSVGIGVATPTQKLDVRGYNMLTDPSAQYNSHFPFSNNSAYLTGENIYLRGGAPQGWRVALTINNASGNVGIGTTGPTHRFHVVAAEAVGLFESTGPQAYLRLSTNEGINNRVEITNRPGGRLTLWTAAGGDVFSIARDGQIFVGNNKSGPFVRFNDDLWFSDPQNGTIHIRNANNSNWGTLVGSFQNMSSRKYKKEICALQAGEAEKLLNDTLSLALVRFKYQGDEEVHRLRLGIIAEEAPTYIVGDDGESLSTIEYIAMLHGAIKALANRLVAFEEKLVSTGV